MSDPFPYIQSNDMSGTHIEASNHTLLRQAPMTTDTYMGCAVACIDRKFGKGYAAKHPELVGAFMTASAIDMGTAVIARAIQNELNVVAQAIENTSANLRSDHPLLGETFDGVASALNDIAMAIKPEVGAK